MSQPRSKFVSFVQEFSIPLIAGVVVALLWANFHHGSFQALVHWVPEPLHDVQLFHHGLFYFLVNDVFMVLFFGIAAKEITEAALPGGHLNPIKKAMNPLLATLGGVVGPILVFFALLAVTEHLGKLPAGADHALVHRGWGIPTATDIALAWLVARAVFGAGHPAVGFLLLLAVADDAIGLAIIAIFYGDPLHPAEPAWLLLILLAMGVAYALRRRRVSSWVPYVAVAGPLSWAGLVLAHLHPALALVFVVPFLPGPRHDTGLFAEEDEVDLAGPQAAARLGLHHSTLHQFEHDLKLTVDLGLFFFGIANAGVELAEIGSMTWCVFGALLFGKTLGIGTCSLLSRAAGFPLPAHMGRREAFMAGFVASLGLTVALFVAGAAFPMDPVLQGQAKMGALLSGLVGFVAILVGRIAGVRRIPLGPPAG